MGITSHHKESWEHTPPTSHDDAPFGLGDWSKDKAIHMTTTVHVSRVSVPDSDEAVNDARSRIQGLRQPNMMFKKDNGRDFETLDQKHDFAWVDEIKN